MASPMTPHNEEFMPSGLKIEGPFENKRNRDNAELLRSVIAEVYGADQCIVAHHITYVAKTVEDGYTQEVVEEIPSIDTLMFDHEIAKTIWGRAWKEILKELAIVPVPERDAAFARLYYGRQKAA